MLGCTPSKQPWKMNVDRDPLPNTFTASGMAPQEYPTEAGSSMK